MSALLWIVFSWMVFGTIVGALLIPVQAKTVSQVIGRVFGTLVNLGSCVVVAVAAVML